MVGRWYNILAVVALLSMWSCQTEAPAGTYLRLEGQTMGTSYSVIYQGQDNYQQAIDSLLLVLNQEVSTYIPTSVISVFNQAEQGIALANFPHYQYFLDNLSQSREVVAATDGAFQPTLMPLVNYWGFGYTEKRAVTQTDSLQVAKLMEGVGMQWIRQTADSVVKSKPGVQLDFSAIAKGYGVDLIGHFLEEQGVIHFFVEIGGEVLARGLSSRGDAWRVGISLPREEVGLDQYAQVAPLDNQAVATSGNYRNYYEVAGEKYGHTINPQTGYPEKNNLLSSSVFAENCATADAYATAFMVMGFEKARQLVEELEGVEAYFIVGLENGGMQPHFSSGLSHLMLSAE